MRNRVYFNTDKLCFSLLDYKTNKVVKYADNIFMTNALFVVRKSGQKRVREEGRKNVHAFVNGIIQNRLPNNQDLFYNCHSVRYDPYTMDYFHYERIVNGNAEWLPVDRHWIGNVYLSMTDGKPRIYADIDKLSGEKLSASALNGEPIHVIKDETCIKRYYDGGGFSMEFLSKKQKQIENKKKLLAI